MSGLGGLINRDDVLPFYEQLARIIANKDWRRASLPLENALPTELDLPQLKITRSAAKPFAKRSGSWSVGACHSSAGERHFRRRRAGHPRFGGAAQLHRSLINRGIMPEMELLEFRVVEPPEEFAAAHSAERESHAAASPLRRQAQAAGDCRHLYAPYGQGDPLGGCRAARHLYTIFGKFLAHAGGARLGDDPRRSRRAHHRAPS